MRPVVRVGVVVVRACVRLALALIKSAQGRASAALARLLRVEWNRCGENDVGLRRIGRDTMVLLVLMAYFLQKNSKTPLGENHNFGCNAIF